MSSQPPDRPPEGSQPPQQPQWKPQPSGASTRRTIALAVIGVLILFAILGNLDDGGSSEQSTDQATAIVEVRTAPVDLCWSGAFGNRSVDGCGDSRVDLQSDIGIFSANAQKQDEFGSLTLVLLVNGKQVDSATTTAAYGVASVSGSTEEAK
jgi:hypothetical protein